MAFTDHSDHPAYLAVSDESHYNVGRFRSLALVSLRQEHAPALCDGISAILKDSGVREFKWRHLSEGRYQHAAFGILEQILPRAIGRVLRVDVLMWDTQDRRHNVVGRDDVANLGRMYYHLFCDVLRKRWPDGSTWRLCPDENTAMDWDIVADLLSLASVSRQPQPGLLDATTFRARLRLEFGLQDIVPCKSHEQPLAQVADLFAGLAVYSRTSYDRYEYWRSTNSHQLSLFPSALPAITLSRADLHRCAVLAELNARCKRARLGVSLDTYRGLRTRDPGNPINFWWYEPQHVADKAPTRDGVAAFGKDAPKRRLA